MFGMFPAQYYGDVIRWFVGIVEQVGGDIPQLGRVRVRIHGIHGPASELSLADLPYASVMLPTTEGGVSGIGRAPGIVQGATVFGIFMDGTNSQLPLVLGSIPKMEVPSATQLAGMRTGIPYQSSGVPYSTSTHSMHDSLTGAPPGVTYNPNSNEQQNVQIAWDYFMSTNNYSKEQVAGMIGNFLVESRMNPGIRSGIATADGGTENSIGIAQWYFYGATGGRQTALRNFAAQKGKNWDDLFVQLAFVDHELATVPSLGGAQFKRTTTVADAALVFMRKYEVPDSTGVIGPDGIEMRLGQDDRVGKALAIYENFANSGGSSSSAAGS